MRIILISCAAKKRDTRCKASEMYISPLFRKSWAYAQQLNPDAIYILSAKHHLLNPDSIIAPYNVTLKNFSAAERKEWAAEVIKEMKQAGLDLEHDEFVFLAGAVYYKNLLPNIKHYSLPLKGKGGIGCILKFLTNAIQ